MYQMQIYKNQHLTDKTIEYVCYFHSRVRSQLSILCPNDVNGGSRVANLPVCSAMIVYLFVFLHFDECFE